MNLEASNAIAPGNAQPVAARYVQMHPADNVAIVSNEGGLPVGSSLANGVLLNERVPQGHKVALVDIAAGTEVRRYNVCIGFAVADISAGAWINDHLLRMPEARSAKGLPVGTRAKPLPPPPVAWATRTFMGYRNRDGSVGTRNILAISTTVQCVSGVVDIAVRRIKSELLPLYSNVDDVVGLEHSYGCGVAIDAPDAKIPIRTLRHISANPNFGGELMVVSLGCEKLQPTRLFPNESQFATIPISDQRTPGAPATVSGASLVTLQDSGHLGFQSMIDSIVESARYRLEKLNARRREACPISELVVGVQCGGSDAFSGVTANPAVGAATDLLVRCGATVMFSENTEVRDAIDQLTSRAASTEVAEGIIRELTWYDEYLKRGGADRSANTTPGNKAGGLSNIVEKAMGSVVKSGTGPIHAVLPPGEKLPPGTHGLVFASTPASDFICGTLQLAAGMNLHVFTTGRGTPYSLAACPVVKVATRTDLARRWHDLMDLNAGRIADGETSVEEMGEELVELLLQVASGQATWAERWGLHNALTLFNPAPVT